MERYNIIFEFKYIIVFLLGLATAAPASIDSSPETFWNPSYALAFGLFVLVASLVILSMALMVCMDCMNSEVSSESHPASMSATPKWGGAINYQRGGQGEGGTDSCFISEQVNINDLRNAPLPYSMIPTQIPESGEFRGYQTGGADHVHGGVSGYSSTNATAPPSLEGYSAHSNAAGFSTNNSGGQGRHYNPAERDDPPPSYSEAAHQ